MRIIAEKDFENFVNGLIARDDREVVGVQSRNSHYVFDDLEDAKDLALDYDVTILPPKKYLMPQTEAILEYEKKKGDFSMEPLLEVEPRIIIGIHPYDLIAIQQMDKVFSDTYEDEYYLDRRKECILIGVNMQNVSDRSFAASMGTATTDSGYDLMLTDLGDKYAVEIGSSKGSDLLENAKTRNASSEEVEKVEEVKRRVKEKFEKELEFSPKELPTLLDQNYENMNFWEENSETCYSCGTCNLVCPTCYCFDVEDVNEITMDSGKRVRRWDGCLLEGFAVVAGGENFRDNRAERYRHRYMRKGKYIYDRYGDIACVGCGRCASQCIPDIADPCRVYNDMKEMEAE
ncbi:Ni/Fe hydrogenase subunit beta [candidate division MSBL1 archaeon SCGC-AAA259I14]|uniref:Ni/Fe hydrogenase subunit beta n=1 Tax=candidate division MSBL1 archaeon SCGC-AAA259I14 TaxID=1698268 RepID=A0A133UU92_9EURY|nr:Ni/Fe hydrogenase subunit beta [candidate division MSBL1 archaeon SCGC-AAA259I14]